MKRRPLVLVMLFLFFSFGLLDVLALCFFHDALDTKEVAPVPAAISCVDRAEQPFLSATSPAQKRISRPWPEKEIGSSHPATPSCEAVKYAALARNRAAFHPPSPIYQFDTIYRI